MRLAILLLLWPVCTAWAALENKQQELQALHGRIERLKEELEQASGEHAEAADALKTSEQRISQVNRSILELSRDEKQLNRELARLEHEARATQGRLEEQRARLAHLLRERYIRGGDDAAVLILNGRDPGEIARSLNYLAYLGQARAQLINEQQSNLAKLNELLTEMDRRKTDISLVRNQRQAQKKALEGEKTARQAILGKLSQQIRLQRREIDTLKRDEARLSRLIEKLRKLAEAPKPSTKPGKKIDHVANAALAGLDFPKLKGKLAFPIAGEIAARFGEAREGGGPSWKGLFIRAREGQGVRAVASGQVVFADWLRGFGNLLILDHGGGYLSLYSNNESLYKQPGQAVRAGDVIATAGNSGGQEESGLYFELRYQGKPFDPMQWVDHR